MMIPTVPWEKTECDNEDKNRAMISVCWLEANGRLLYVVSWDGGGVK